MSFNIRLFALSFTILPVATFAQDRSDGVDVFERKIRPILAENCYNCHSASTNAKGGLRVDDRKGLLDGGRSGAAVVAGHPETSLLLQAVKHTGEAPKMPPGKTLSAEQIADLERWIRDGAAWPAVTLPISSGGYKARYDKLRKEHWAWQPLREVKVPAVHDSAWPASDIDRFVLARLEEKKLAPVGDAERRVLIRRVTFDLTGLPPTPREIDDFLSDDRADAYAGLVDRLLASPAFGERWGRHWLDVARYGESTGSSRNVPFPHAWRYRDYVIDAFNQDKPFNQFIKEQIAGDLLPAGSDAERRQQLIATGFLALGVKDVNQRFKVRFIMDNIDEQIDTVSRAILGLTVSCARCHDHKFDPIPTADYYALAGIFQSSDLCAGVRNKMGGGGLDYYDPALLVHLGPSTAPDAALAGKIADLEKRVGQARADFVALRDSPQGNEIGADGRPKKAAARQKMNLLQKELLALNDPAAKADVAFGVREAKTIGDTEIRVRGEAEKLGPTVPRGFLSVLDVPGAAALNREQSGRLQLAEWLASDGNPLTPRVAVNRVWKHLFGAGIVSSVDNFGVTGDVPSHPELLDHLARRFVDQGWSVKKLVREIVLSRTYRLGGETPAEHRKADPANRLLWRHSPRRLDAEEIRDAMLAASGQLERSRVEGSPARDLKVMEIRNNGPEARELQDAAQNSRHRSVYLPLLRGITPRSLEVFDFAEQGLVTGARETTTVAPQALYLLNDPFVQRQALHLAESLLKREGLSDAERADLAFQIAFGRTASATESQRTQEYLADYEAAERGTVRPARVAVKPAPKAVTPKKGPANPDEIDQTDEPQREEAVVAGDPRTAAWASFCQALLASAEFRYLR